MVLANDSGLDVTGVAASVFEAAKAKNILAIKIRLFIPFSIVKHLSLHDGLQIRVATHKAKAPPLPGHLESSGVASRFDVAKLVVRPLAIVLDEILTNLSC